MSVSCLISISLLDEKMSTRLEILVISSSICLHLFSCLLSISVCFTHGFVPISCSMEDMRVLFIAISRSLLNKYTMIPPMLPTTAAAVPIAVNIISIVFMCKCSNS